MVSRENGALERENMSVEDFFMKFYYKEEQRNEVVAVKKYIGSMECLFACFLSVFFYLFNFLNLGWEATSSAPSLEGRGCWKFEGRGGVKQDGSAGLFCVFHQPQVTGKALYSTRVIFVREREKAKEGESAYKKVIIVMANY